MHERPDVLLAHWSDEMRSSPGLLQKPLACDFIAYAYGPVAICSLLPVPALQRTGTAASPALDRAVLGATGREPRIHVRRRTGAKGGADAGDCSNHAGEVAPEGASC